ncbi:MAG: hypothetical protein ITG02_12490 [Patulibacter sp.]|nr:hypothetical protein [Patulibacter sp.]
MELPETKCKSPPGEHSFARVFMAIGFGVITLVGVITLTAGGSAYWVVATTAVLMAFVGLILYELGLLLADEENDEDD